MVPNPRADTLEEPWHIIQQRSGFSFHSSVFFHSFDHDRFKLSIRFSSIPLISHNALIIEPTSPSFKTRDSLKPSQSTLRQAQLCQTTG